MNCVAESVNRGVAFGSRNRDAQELRMPRISQFYGIVVYMYYRDHAPPQFHAIYGEYEAEIEITTMILHIVEAQVRGPSLLKVTLNNGTCKTVNVAPLLTGPVFEPLRDPAYFARVELDPVCGTVVWPNGADFAPEALHELAAAEEPSAA